MVGNPQPASRTLAAASYVARELSGAEPDLVVDLATVGPGLLGWGDPVVKDLVEQVGAADLVVFTCPTYKATYTGLSGVAVPLMLGGSPAHSLAPELTLRPVLAEIGGACVRGHHVVDASYDDPAAYADWLAAVRPAVTALVAR